MQPVELRYERGEFVIVHQCTVCAQRRPNRAAPDDDLSSLL
jgi:hypothetical protein